MRVFAHVLAIGCVVAVLPRAVSIGAQAPAPATKDAAAILAQAREALGGEKRLSAVRNFVATGRTRQVRGDNLVPIEFEIACELPDKFVRKDEIPAQESGPTSTGFNGDQLIQLPVPVMPAVPAQPPARPQGAEPPQRGASGGRMAGPAAPAQMDAMRNARVATVKQDFLRLTLGMFAASFSSYPVTFTYAGQAEAPQGTADVLDVKGVNFSAKLFVNSQTHLPIMVSWEAPAGRGRGPAPAGAPAGAPPGAAVGAPAAPPRPVEYRLYYGDYRDVDGMQWPFRLRRATGSDTTEETTFDRFKVNTKIDSKKFEVRK